MESPAELLARVDTAAHARARIAARPLGETIDALVAAAARWREDRELAAALPATTGLSSPVIAAGIGFAAEAIDAGAMTALAERAWGPGAARRARTDAPALVAQVVASNVPALALPAIVLGCLAGAAVLVKSGRDDALSALAFRRALDVVDPELAATVVAAYWPGGDAAREEPVFARADRVVVTGGDTALAALTGRLGRSVVAHGPRSSVAIVGREASRDASVDALALDVAMYDQRGCLSPHAVYVEGDGRAFARRLGGALDAIAEHLPHGSPRTDERAALRLLVAEAEWAPGVEMTRGRGGTVIYEEAAVFRPTPGLRTVRVHPVEAADRVAALLPPATIESVGIAGLDGRALAAGLRDRGVSRICPVGRMQRPRLTWPRGQHAPLGVLLGRRGEPELEVET
jgi:acyl-CoA reductase LuxC